jgi:hypothetical protein
MLFSKEVAWKKETKKQKGILGRNRSLRSYEVESAILTKDY